MKLVTLFDIQSAQKNISKVVHKTPLDQSSTFSEMVGAEVYLKRENEQRTGSFKIRGAYNKMSRLTPEEKAAGVIACSAGNHAQGVALSASLNGISSTIVMPTSAPMVKVEATQKYGAKVILKGQMVDESAEHAYELSKKNGYIFVHPYEDRDVIAGQGTLILEVFDEGLNPDSIIVPIGGGGLIAGTAVAAKALNPKCKIFGVQSAKAPGMAAAYKSKSTTGASSFASTIADGIAVKKASQVMYDNYISRLVDDVVTVTEDEIAEAIVLLMERSKAVVEGAGAAGIAAMLARKLPLGQKTCVLLSGGNIDMNLIEKIIERGLSRRGRVTRLSVIVGDVPGQLSRLTESISQARANILQVEHDRIHSGLGIMETRIEFLLETNGFEHVKEIKANLTQLGVTIL